jgi:hypothetical protein
MAKRRLDPRVQTLLDRYLKDGEFPTKLPARGLVLIHNGVRPTTIRQRHGTKGFRVWTQRLDESQRGSFVVCKCGWSGLKHYESKDSAERRNETAPA